MSTRQIKDAVNHSTGELVYFKSHAKATFMSDGKTVEEAIKNIKPNIDLSDYVKSEELEGYAKTEDIPSLEGYAKTEDIPSLDNYASKEWVNNKNYATEYDLNNIDYGSIKNVPVSEDETGELNITDESGNIGMKIASEAIYGKDFIAGEHKLSEKVDKTYVDDSIAELVDGAPETLDTLNELAAALNDNADIVDVLNQSISNKQNTITDLETIRQGAAKGATALQSYTEQYKGTVTGVKFNGGDSIQPNTNGIVDLGTIVTDANVQAVDTGDVLDDVNVDYATIAYVDGLVGDINSVLESIINGEGGTDLITFTIADTEYQAENGMTWGEWIDSEYNVDNYQHNGWNAAGCMVRINSTSVIEDDNVLINNHSYILDCTNLA